MSGQRLDFVAEDNLSQVGHILEHARGGHGNCVVSHSYKVAAGEYRAVCTLKRLGYAYVVESAVCKGAGA